MITLILDEVWHYPKKMWRHPKRDRYECRGWSCDYFRIDDSKYPWDRRQCHLNSCKFKQAMRVDKICKGCGYAIRLLGKIESCVVCANYRILQNKCSRYYKPPKIKYERYPWNRQHRGGGRWI